MDLKDYVKVDDLIKRMNEEYPEGRLITELVNQIGDLVVFKATFYNGDSDPICTGHGAEKIVRDKKLEKAESVARGRCLRVLFSEKPLYEEMEDIVHNNSETSKKPQNTANKPRKDVKYKYEGYTNEKTPLDQKLEDAGVQVNDVSESKQHIMNNIKDYALTVTGNDLDKARTFTAQALGEMNISKHDVSINNMQSIKNKISHIVNLSTIDNDKGE